MAKGEGGLPSRELRLGKPTLHTQLPPPAWLRCAAAENRTNALACRLHRLWSANHVKKVRVRHANNMNNTAPGILIDAIGCFSFPRVAQSVARRAGHQRS